MRDFVYAKKDTLLVFAHANGLTKINLKTQDTITFGYPEIVIWYGRNGTTQSLFDYKSIHITEDNQIITCQENNIILVWDLSMID